MNFLQKYSQLLIFLRIIDNHLILEPFYAKQFAFFRDLLFHDWIFEFFASNNTHFGHS